MNEATCITIVLSRLDSIPLPDIQLPRVTADAVDRERVAFGVKYYVYGSIAHVRTVMRGLAQMADDANWACANILARHLMEWAAHATFVKTKLPGLIASERWDKAWNLLLQLNGGDLYFRRFGAKYLDKQEFASAPIPEPFSVANFLNVYDLQGSELDGRGQAKEDYSLLSELSHANAACLRQHLQTFENRISFSRSEDDVSPLSIASVSILDWLLNITELLSTVAEQSVTPHLVATLRALSGEPQRASWDSTNG